MMVAVLSMSQLHAMKSTDSCDIQSNRRVSEWDPKLYTKGAIVHKTSAEAFIEKSGISLQGKDVLDVGCGPGDVSVGMAQQASSVDGLDQSYKMVDWAKKTYKDVSSLSFKQGFIEDFTSTKKYQLITSFYCFSLIADKQKAFECCYDCLDDGGDFLFTINTTKDGLPLAVEVMLEMIPGLSYFTSIKAKVDESIKNAFSNDEDILRQILEDIGFAVHSIEPQKIDFTFKNRTELEEMGRSLIMSTPFAQWIPMIAQNYLFNKFIEQLLVKLEKNDAGEYVFPAIRTSLVHVSKNR